jgi:formylglycine-generating enzyme required for sulfatase activity
MASHPEIFKSPNGTLKVPLAQEIERRRRNREGQPPSRPDMVFIQGREFTMGSDHHYPEEGPAHRETVGDFWIDRYPVTNLDFSKFVDATGYVTLAERAPDPSLYPGARPEMLQPASVVFRKPPGRVRLDNHLNWWAYVPGANWRHPLGPRTGLNGKAKHPVVQIAYEDAEAYAKWIGKELPTEAEWEFAARGGLEGAPYAWGDEFLPHGYVMANTWHGEFPWQNLQCGGYEGTSPVGSFPANGYGLSDMIGNVWEWTTDWYGPRHSMEAEASCCGPALTARERSYDPATPGVEVPRKVIKGGSYLCALNYCQRYRPAARMGQPVDSASCHIGFRCVQRDGGN